MDTDSLLSILRSVWTLWMAILFLGIVTYACWPGNRQAFHEASMIPLEPDQTRES